MMIWSITYLVCQVSLFLPRLKSKLCIMASQFKKDIKETQPDFVFCAMKLIFEYSHIRRMLGCNSRHGPVFKICNWCWPVILLFLWPFTFILGLERPWSVWITTDCNYHYAVNYTCVGAEVQCDLEKKGKDKKGTYQEGRACISPWVFVTFKCTNAHFLSFPLQGSLIMWVRCCRSHASLFFKMFFEC